MNDVAAYFSDIVMEAPHTFSTGKKTYSLYPLTLGKLMLVQRQLEGMEMSAEGISQWPVMEVVKTVREHRESCLLVIYYATAKDKAECFDVKRIRKTVDELSKTLTDEDIATLMVYILTDDKTEKVKSHYGIDKENGAMNSVLKAKSQGGSMSFGGKTLIGAVIDQACERYGWTVDYVVWGISYSTLRLLMADRVNTLYLSEDERNKVPAHILQRDEDVIKASRETMGQIKSMSWK